MNSRTLNPVRTRFVVQVEPEEKQPEFQAVSVVPVVEEQVPFNPPRTRERVRVDIEAEEQRRQASVEQLLKEDTIRSVQERVTIVKPRAPRRKLNDEKQVSSPEEAFRRRLSQPNETERIERLYQQRNERPAPKKQVKKGRKFDLLDLQENVMNAVSSSMGKRMVMAMLLSVVVFSGSLVFGAWAVRADLRSTEAEVKALLSDLQESRVASVRDRLGSLKAKRNRYGVVYQAIRPVFRFVQGKEKTTHVDQLFEIVDSGFNIMETGLESYSVLETGYRQFLGQEEGKSTSTFSEVSGQLEVLFTELSSLHAKAARLGNPYSIAMLEELLQGLDDRIPRLRKYFLSAQQLSYVLPEILGDGGKKKQYLVLLQNNAELRPTGGFIGSFAIVTMEGGKFLDFRVEDVYEADGQLNGYVAPPPEIIQYLGEAQWFLRDVNWSPDFPTVAKQATWFLEKELKIKPDGVLGINLNVVRKLLEVTGPIRLVDYDEVITKDNLYERAQQHAELNFFPGSTQKRDFLSAVASALFERLMREDTNKMLIMKALVQAADEAELLISIPDEQATKALSNLGWDGSLRTPDCPGPFAQQTCFVDTVMQVEANVGVNKANQYIKRSIRHDISIERGQAVHERSITLQNTADSNAWPEGSYKNYFRLFVTKGAQLNAVTVNGAPVDLRSVSVKEEQGKQVFGFLVTVPIQSTSKIDVSYTVPLLQESPLVYSLFEQKQPGVGNDGLETSIKVNGRQVVTVAPEPVISGNTMKFSGDRKTHQFLAVELK